MHLESRDGQFISQDSLVEELLRSSWASVAAQGHGNGSGACAAGNGGRHCASIRTLAGGCQLACHSGL